MKLFFLNSGQIEIKKKIFVPQITTDEKFLLPVISTLIQYKNLNILFIRNLSHLFNLKNHFEDSDLIISILGNQNELNNFIFKFVFLLSF